MTEISSLKPDFQVHVTESHTKRTEIIRLELGAYVEISKSSSAAAAFSSSFKYRKWSDKKTVLNSFWILLTLTKTLKTKNKNTKKSNKNRKLDFFLSSNFHHIKRPMLHVSDTQYTHSRTHTDTANFSSTNSSIKYSRQNFTFYSSFHRFFSYAQSIRLAHTNRVYGQKNKRDEDKKMPIVQFFIDTNNCQKSSR